MTILSFFTASLPKTDKVTCSRQCTGKIIYF